MTQEPTSRLAKAVGCGLTRRGALGVAALAFASPAVRAQGTTQGVSASEIVLGSHLDLSGPVAAGMPALRNGMQLRLDEANERGGIHGRRFRLIVEDNGSQPQMAVRAANKLVQQDQVFAILNSFGSATNAATLKRIVDAGVPVFSPWGASSVFRRVSGNSPLLFTTTPNYDTTMKPAVEWMLTNQNRRRVGYIFQEGPLGELVGVGLKAALAGRNMTLAAEASYRPGDVDFSSHVQRMRAANCDLVCTATITRETIGVMAEVKKIGWNDVAVMTSPPGRTMLVSRLGAAAVEGLFGAGLWNIIGPNDPNPAVQATWAAMKTRYNQDPDENALLSYAYTDMFVRAVEAAGQSLTNEGLARALAGVSSTHPAFYGPTRFKDGHIDPEAVRIEQVRNGAWTPVSPLIG
jgi:branched-chain amino acid transport system substrate-binding protein